MWQLFSRLLLFRSGWRGGRGGVQPEACSAEGQGGRPAVLLHVFRVSAECNRSPLLPLSPSLSPSSLPPGTAYRTKPSALLLNTSSCSLQQMESPSWGVTNETKPCSTVTDGGQGSSVYSLLRESHAVPLETHTALLTDLLSSLRPLTTL